MTDSADQLAAAIRAVINDAVQSALAHSRLPLPSPESPKPEPPKPVEAQTEWPPERMLYPISEVRQKLGGISPTTFYQLVADEQIVIVKIGRRSFVSGAFHDASVRGPLR
jgi:hypothetical protein